MCIEALAGDCNVHASNSATVIAVYIAEKGRPRSLQLVAVYDLKGLRIFDHPERVACIIEDEEANDGRILVVTRLLPASIKG